tara:strand:- start:2644 stop:3243 length:600 start_codon:yes stop_codon:yes gene_type:complete
MEEATPINQLSGRDHKNTVENMSYSEILGQMQSPANAHPSMPPSIADPNSTTIMPPNGGVAGGSWNGASPNQPQHPQGVLQHQHTTHPSSMEYTHPFMDPYMMPKHHVSEDNVATNAVESTKTTHKNEDFQNEMIVLLAVYVLIHTEQFQSLLRSKLPSMFNADTNNINIFGTLVTGIILVIGWNVSRKIVVKYMKEFN